MSGLQRAVAVGAFDDEKRHAIFDAADKRLRAFDLKTGKEIWTFRLPASLYGTPLTYQGKSGKQYVAAVTTGGFWGESTGADEVTAFALP